MEDDPRMLRLFDVATHEAIRVVCPSCRKIVEYPHGLMQRRFGLPSDLLIFDLQFKLRCARCNCRSGFRISIIDGRMRSPETRDQQVERVIVEGAGC